jgi:hypothetical protein
MGVSWADWTVCLKAGRMVRKLVSQSELMGGSLGSWMGHQRVELTAAPRVF